MSKGHTMRYATGKAEVLEHPRYLYEERLSSSCGCGPAGDRETSELTSIDDWLN